MFPFQTGDLSFQVSNDFVENTTNDSSICFLQNIEQDVNVTSASSTQLLGLGYDHIAQLAKNPIPRSPRSPSTKKLGRNRSSLGSSTHSTNTSNNDTSNGNNDKADSNGNTAAKKRTIHRETERQRREEMSSLYSSLRSTLPMEYIKGKRSISDHIAEATKYIKDLEKNVKELKDKKEQLKSLGNIGCSTSSASSSSKHEFSVSIHTFSKAIEIEITAAGITEEDPFPLSRVLRVLSEEGLHVASCVSSKVDPRWIYVIHSEVDGVLSIDSCQLQGRLTNEIS